MKKILYSIIGLSVLLTACKYEEGPGVSLRSKRDRIANEWKVDAYSYTAKGGSSADRTGWYNVKGDVIYTYFTKPSSVNPSGNELDSTSVVIDYSYVLVLTRTGAYTQEVIDGNNNSVDPRLRFNFGDQNYKANQTTSPDPLGILAESNNGEWAFTAKHSRIQMGIDLGGSNYVAEDTKAGRNVPVIFDIVMLRNDEMKLSAIDADGGKHEYTFKPIKEEKYLSFKKE
jgi:hypothetical protein